MIFDSLNQRAEIISTEKETKMFKKQLLALLLATTVGTAVYAADLPKNKVQPLSPGQTLTIRPYVQGQAGFDTEGKVSVFGAKGGLETTYLRTDIGYDYFSKRNLFSANAYVQVPVYSFTPYVGAGLGRVYDDKLAKGDDVFLATAGSRYNLNTNWALDVNYRHIRGIDDRKIQGNQVTAGVVYKF